MFECVTCVLLQRYKTNQSLADSDFEWELEQSPFFYFFIWSQMNPKLNLQPEKACINIGLEPHTLGFSSRVKSQKHHPCVRNEVS